MVSKIITNLLSLPGKDNHVHIHVLRFYTIKISKVTAWTSSFPTTITYTICCTVFLVILHLKQKISSNELTFLIHKISARRFEYLLTSFYVLIHVQDSFFILFL
jgi:hypothetical protein